MNDEKDQAERPGGLAERDRAFLRDIEQTNWLNHYVVAESLVRVGAESPDGDHPVADSIIKWHNHEPNLAFLDRERIEVTPNLVAQVQSIAMLRIFQERTAAMESLGALICAVKTRADGGVARQYCAHDPRYVTQVYREVLNSRDTPLWVRLGWSSPEEVRSRTEENRAAMIEALYKWMTAKVAEVAEGYLRPDGVNVVRLGEVEPDHDPRRYVYVILGPEEWDSRRRIDDGLMARAYGALKHGFNTTGLFTQYAEASREGRTLMALEVPKSNALVQRFGQEINLVGKLCQQIARWTLEFDAWGALRNPDRKVPGREAYGCEQ